MINKENNMKKLGEKLENLKKLISPHSLEF